MVARLYCLQQRRVGHAKRLDVTYKERLLLGAPTQIRTCGLPAYGSHLEYLTAKRTLGQGVDTGLREPLLSQLGDAPL